MEDTTTRVASSSAWHQHTTIMNEDEEEEEEEEEEQQPLLRRGGERRKRRKSSTFEDEDDEEKNRKNDDDTNGLLKHHPRGLLVLSGVEIWERFGYYTARAVLVLFARDEIFASKESIKNVWLAQWFARVHGMMMDVDGGGGDLSSKRERMEREALSSKLYGTYTALAYLTPMLGGFVADFTSKHSMISTGIGLMWLGYGIVGAERKATFAGLLLVAVGNGGFKPNVSARLSEMYESNKRKKNSNNSNSNSNINNNNNNDNVSRTTPLLLSRKDAAFGIFYCAINVGALFAPLVAGVLAERFGYQSCFVAAAIGMMFAGVVYFTFQRKLVYRGAALDIERSRSRRGNEDEDEDDEQEGLEEVGTGENDERYDDVNNADNASLPRNTVNRDDTSIENADEESPRQQQQQQQQRLSLLHVFNENKARMTALFVVMFTTVGFWAAYEQAGNALSLFIDERVSRDGIPTAAFQSINPGMILALTPIINRYWKYQSETNREPDQVMKMSIGCCLLGLANILLAFASNNLPAGAVDESDLPPHSKLNQFWIWLYFLVATAGELYVSPVGLSFVTTAAPKEIVGFACGCWFLSAFFGNYLAGEIGSRYARSKPRAFWFAVGCLSISVGLLLAAMRRRIVDALKMRASPVNDDAPPREDDGQRRRSFGGEPDESAARRRRLL